MKSSSSSRLLLLCTVCYPLGALPLVAGQDASGEVLAQVRSRNAEAVRSIHTLYCRYAKLSTDGEGRPKPGQEPPGEYWRSAGMVRHKIPRQADGRATDRLVREGRAITLTAPGGGQPPAAFIAPDDGIRGPLDPWVVARLTFIGSIKRPGRYTFDECIAFPDDPWRVPSVQIQGAGGPVTVNLNLPGANVTCPTEIVFDPLANYLVRSIRTTTPGPKASESETVVTRFREVRPGIFFPEEIKTKSKYDGKLMGTDVVSLTDIKINADVPKGTFDLKLPPATRVTDETTGTEYTIADDGGHKNEKAMPLPPPPASGQSRTETKEEPQSRVWLILPIALAVLAAAVVTRLILRRRAGRE